jgi:hypothetical protein
MTRPGDAVPIGAGTGRDATAYVRARAAVPTGRKVEWTSPPTA